MIDIDREQLRLLSHASKDVPGRPHVSTLVRWAGKGVRGIRLETVMIGGRRYTSVEAIHSFVQQLSGQRCEDHKSSDAGRTVDRRVQQELDRAGI